MNTSRSNKCTSCSFFSNAPCSGGMILCWSLLASVSGDKAHLAAESADVLYHLGVLWAAAGITPEDVYAELKKREGASGLDEKASRAKK